MYVHWAMRYILFHNKRHPAEMSSLEIEAFLSYLAQEVNVSASRQNQAINALLFLYRNVLQIELATPIHALRAKRAQHLALVRRNQGTGDV
jgi:Phage integrase, N-terminal SAM-like domain